jgi:hypothetical protein
LYEDDARPRQKAVWSVYLSLMKSKKNTAICLSLDPAHEPNPKDGFAVNGISTIQYYDKTNC